MKSWLIIILSCLFPIYVSGQVVLDDNDQQVEDPSNKGMTRSSQKDGKDKKKKKENPVGLKVWQADDRFGVIDSVEIDTFSHRFQNSNYTEGVTGLYNTLGNMGSPRLSHLFELRPKDFSYFIFAEPYDFFITPFSQIHFTNTKSPITNLTYHESNGSDNGEDRIMALYAINMNKDIGFGLKLDYLYGRGYYNYQSTADFNATFFGSILKEQYQAHFSFYSNYLKTAENGGITDDNYVTNPENFPSKFGTNDIPTRLNKVWNKMHVDGLQWTHRYSIGFRKVVSKADTVKKEPNINAEPLHERDLAKTGNLDSITRKDTVITPEQTKFVAVTSFIHTLKLQNNTRRFMANEDLSQFYTNRFFEGDSTLDKVSNTLISNLFAIELHEGFNKWAMAGLRLYGQHDYNSYKMPSARRLFEKYNENRITLGAQLFKEQGEKIHYNLQAETSSDGKTWGDFKLSGKGVLNLQLWGDTVSLTVHGNIINRQPTFFYRNYQSQYIWWNNSLDKQFTSHVGAVLQSRKTKTRIGFDVQNIRNYTYLANEATQVVGESKSYYTYNTIVNQASKDIKLVSAVLNQDFKLGILNWENQIAYQKTSDSEALPLPELSVYSNLYLLFRIAKVLRVEFGGDVRYFTSYYSPTYSPAVGLYAVQSPEDRIKVGNYPIIDIYANFHLKHTRFYIMASHVNYSNDGSGSKFLTPHYPINPFIIKMGLSWNFFN